MSNLRIASLAALMASAIAFPAAAQSRFDFQVGAGYAYVLPETHAFLAELDLYWFPVFPEGKELSRWALTLDLRFLAYEDGLGGAICLGASVFFLGEDEKTVEEAYFRAGIVPLDEIAFYGELGWAWHAGVFAFNAGIGFFQDTLVIKVAIGAFL